MDGIVKEMIRIYKPKGICWLGYKITKKNPITYHHCITKACDGGKRNLENGALVSKIGHQYLHLTEVYDYEVYRELNNIFQEINMQGHTPTKEQYMMINECLKYFESRYANVRTNKGKYIIQPQFYKREIYSFEEVDFQMKGDKWIK